MGADSPYGQLVALLAQPGVSEILPKFTGAARQDPAFQQSVESGYASVPDPFREFLRQKGYRITGAENLSEAAPQFRGEAAGVTYPSSGLIAVSNTPRDPAFTQSTAVHELGHAVDAALGNVSQQPGFQRYWQPESGATPQLYGGQSPAEGFAEMFTRNYLVPNVQSSLPQYDAYTQSYPQTLNYVRQALAEWMKKQQGD